MQNFLLKTRFLFIVILAVFTACRTTEEHKTITIATAANMQFAMQELADTFTQKTGTSCDVVISSSGKLTAQISEKEQEIKMMEKEVWVKEAMSERKGVQPPSRQRRGRRRKRQYFSKHRSKDAH